jgi:hypothetical protein
MARLQKKRRNFGWNEDLISVDHNFGLQKLIYFSRWQTCRQAHLSHNVVMNYEPERGRSLKIQMQQKGIKKRPKSLTF